MSAGIDPDTRRAVAAYLRRTTCTCAEPWIRLVALVPFTQGVLAYRVAIAHDPGCPLCPDDERDAA